MKKFFALCWILCVLVVLEGALPAALATEPTQAAAQTEPTGSLNAPIPEIPTTGDASVDNGCHSINARVALGSGANLLKTGKAAFLYEMNTDTLIYSVREDERVFPASLTKIMTCLLVAEEGNPEDIVTVSASALVGMVEDGSNVGLKVGEEMSVENLLYCTMVSSGNDAASVLAEYISGSEEAFVARMNERAQELGCTRTNFMNPHGLHDDHHYTTARDLAKMTLEALKHPLFRQIYHTSYYKVPATNLCGERELVTTNYMISEYTVGYYMDKRVIGGKTGTTTPAGRCLMVTAREGDMFLLSIIMGASAQDENTDDGIIHDGRFDETSDMLDYAFKNYAPVQILSDTQALGQFPVADGINQVVGCPEDAMKTLLPKDYNAQDLTWECTGKDDLKAPLAKGDSVGQVRVWYHSNCLAQSKLVALNAVEKKEVTQSTNPSFLPGQTAEQGLTDTARLVLIGVLALVVLLVLITLYGAIRRRVMEAKRRRRRRSRRRSR